MEVGKGIERITRHPYRGRPRAFITTRIADDLVRGIKRPLSRLPVVGRLNFAASASRSSTSFMISLPSAAVLIEFTKWKDGVENLAHVRLNTGFPKRPSFKGTAIMDRKASKHHGYLNRRSFLQDGGRLAGGGLAVGATFETIRPRSAWGQQ